MPARGQSYQRQFVTDPLAPFRLDLTGWALRRRAHNAIDRWDGHVYRRALLLGEEAVALSVTQSGPVLDQLAGRLRGLKPPRFPTVFEALVNGIACPQLSLAVGIHLLNRLTAARGRPVPEDPERLRAFPEPTDLAAAAPGELKLMGFSMAKARTIVETAATIVDDDLDLESLERLDDRAAIALDQPARRWPLDRGVREAGLVAGVRTAAWGPVARHGQAQVGEHRGPWDRRARSAVAESCHYVLALRDDPGLESPYYPRP